MSSDISVRDLHGRQTSNTSWKAVELLANDTQRLDPRLDPGFLDGFDKLSPEQAGHLRHFHNLVTLEDGNWGVMGSQVPGQEWIDAFRYQLATMAYASGAAHYHRLPALRSAFKTLIEAIIAKMLQQEVWSYWYLTSQSGKFVDPDIEQLRKPFADPIKKENIMKAILDQMEAEKWLGVCCEPNSIFVVCNQFPLIATRYNDVHDNTNIVGNVIEKYTAAWKEKGMVQENGLIVQWYMPKQGTMRRALDIGSTAWTSAFMNAWNPIVAKRTFETQAIGFLSETEVGTISLNSATVAFVIWEMTEKEDIAPFSPTTRRKAREWLTQEPRSSPPELPFPSPLFGYVSKWVSEVGDQATLDGLLAHADRFLQPTWNRGGLYYPLCGQREDASGNWTEMDRFTGNAAVGYARLNVFDGQRKMWTDPWTSEKIAQAPFLDGIDLSSGVDFLRCEWNEAQGAMVVTMRTWDGSCKRTTFAVSNLPIGRFGLYLNNSLAGTLDVERPQSEVELSMDVTGNEMNLVMKHLPGEKYTMA